MKYKQARIKSKKMQLLRIKKIYLKRNNDYNEILFVKLPNRLEEISG